MKLTLKVQKSVSFNGSSPTRVLFLFNIVMVLIIWSRTVQISHGDLEVGNLIAFIEYIFHALFSFMLFASVFMMYPRAAVSASRIQEALDMEPAIREEEGVTETATKGYLEFKM